MLPPGSGRMEKRRQIKLQNHIICWRACSVHRYYAVVLLIINESIRNAVEWMIAVAIRVQPSASMATGQHPDVSQRVCRFGTCSVSLSRAGLCRGFFQRRIFAPGDGFFPICANCRRIFLWHIFAADFSVDLSRSCGGFCGGFSADFCQAQNHVNYKSKSPKVVHRKSTAFFTACSP